jgi:hypothetical protein
MFELSITFFFGLILPAAAFAGGIYLVIRGLRRGQASPGVSGALSCQDAFDSHITKRQCAYSKVVIERYRRGHDPWEVLYKLERSVPFRAGRSQVDPEHADFRISAPALFTGYLKPGKGILDELQTNIRHIRSIADFTGEVAPNEFLDESAISAVLGLPGAADKLKTHMKSAFRISEYLLPVGAEVTVFQDPAVPLGKAGPLHGTLEYPLIVSDQAALASAPLVREKSVMSMFLGAILIIISLILLAFVIFS